MATVTKRPSLFAGVVTLLAACGGGETTSPPPPPPPASILSALQLTVPETIVTDQAFPISVTALNSAGQEDHSWNGQVSLAASAGTLTPATVTVTGGRATVQATLHNKSGEVTISATSGSVQTARATMAFSGAPAVRLEVHPSAFLLPAPAATQALTVRAVDAQGAPTTADVVWESSNGGVVSVSASGVAKAEAAAGSAQVTARAGALRSQPALAMVTRPPQGAMLISDAQVAGGLTAVNPSAEYRPGWQYKVRLKGVTPIPVVGQILLASGEAPIGGRVVAATTIGSEIEVTLELLTLRQLMPDLEINQTIPLSDLRPVTAPALPQGPSTLGAALAPEVEFGIGPFDCKASTTVGQVTLVTASGSVISYDVTPMLSLNLVYSVINGLERFVVTGGVVGNLTASPRLAAAVEGAFECKVHLGTVLLPIGGALSMFIASEIPFGVGFAGEAKVNLGDIGFDLQLNVGAQVSLGIECLPTCKAVSSASSSSSGSFEPRFPTLSGDFQVELTESGFGWAELAFGPPFLPNLKFEALEAKLGLKQEARLAPSTVQANNSAYGSELRLAPFFKAGTSAKITNLTALLGITVAELKFEPALPALAESPKGTLHITPASVRAAQPGTPGEKATFTVTLNPVTYLTRYSIQRVEIYRRKPGSGATFLLEPAPISCAEITPNSSSQTTFSCETDFPESMVGDQTFYAFVKPTLFSVPVLLEIGPDAKAVVQVTTPLAVSVSPSTVTVAAGQSRQFSATVTGTSDQRVSWSASAGTITPSGLFTAPSTFGSVTVTARSVADPSRQGTAQVMVLRPVDLTVTRLERYTNGEGLADAAIFPLPYTGCADSSVTKVEPLPPPVSENQTTVCSGSVPGGSLSWTGTGKSSYEIISGSSWQFKATGSSEGTGTGGTLEGPYFWAAGDANDELTLEFDVVGQGVHYELTGFVDHVLPAGSPKSYGMASVEFAGQSWRAGKASSTDPLLARATISASADLPAGHYRLKLSSHARIRSTPGASQNGKTFYDVTLTIRPD